MGQPSRPEPPTSLSPERDSARQAEDLAAFRRMMVASSGTFSLSFVVCQNPALQRALIEEFRTEFPGILVVTLPEGVGDVFAHVVSIAPSAMPEAIFILGMESSIPFEGTVQSAIRVLNSSREQWERFHCPVVFWLADYALARLSTHAPDFWRYRSHQFEFMPEDPSLERAKQESFTDQAMIEALPFEEKRFRLSELETRLHDIGSNPSPDLLPHAVNWSYELASLYKHSNRFEEAERLLRQILNWETAAHGDSSPETAVALNDLAVLLSDTNRMAEAEPLMRRALAMDEAAFGNNHPNVAIRLNNLATLLTATDRLAEAEPLFRRGLTIEQNSKGSDHPNVSIQLNNLAQLLQDTNRMTEAEPLLRRALIIDKASLGKSHPHLAISLNNLATLLRATNRMAVAEPLMKEAVQILEESFGRDHPNSVTTRKNLELLQEEMKRQKKP